MKLLAVCATQENINGEFTGDPSIGYTSIITDIEWDDNNTRRQIIDDIIYYLIETSGLCSRIQIKCFTIDDSEASCEHLTEFDEILTPYIIHTSEPSSYVDWSVTNRPPHIFAIDRNRSYLRGV